MKERKRALVRDGMRELRSIRRRSLRVGNAAADDNHDNFCSSDGAKADGIVTRSGVA